MYVDAIDASLIPEETIRHKLDNSLKEKMKITEEEIKNIEKEEESTQAKMKRNGNIISPDENIFGSTEFLNDEQIKSNDDDDFFDSDSFYDFDEEPEVSIEAADDLPLCSDLSDIETEIGVECFTEERNRDEVLERILQQTWDMLDVSTWLLTQDNVPKKVRRRVRRQIFLFEFWLFPEILRHFFPL